MTPAPVDFLALEPLLVARLRAALPPEVSVLTATDLATVAEGTQPVPAVHVLYRGYVPARPGEAAATWESLDQYWLTVVAVSNASNVIAGDAARAAAGPLMGAVIAALGGYVPDLPGFKSLRLTDAPEAGYRSGFGYFPLGWRVATKVRVARATS
ncbi:MAG: hypothetical protein AzoDbin1_05149 [Azoarcus sp.]|nr:hypothetical protein [Azoarcus sp.]